MNFKEKVGLERQIGAGSLAINAVNLTIGTGIFILPAYVAGYLGAMSFLAYLFCAVLMGLIMLCFAELGSKATSSGGAYGIIENAFGPVAGFAANTLFWFGYACLSDAAILNATSDMLGIWFPIFTHVYNPFYDVVFHDLPMRCIGGAYDQHASCLMVVAVKS